jgi:hypothetical protein
MVEVAFAANIKTDMEVLAQGGSIATYATNAPTPEIPFWELVFVNARIFFVGSDDVPADAKIDAMPAWESKRDVRYSRHRVATTSRKRDSLLAGCY